MAEQNFCTNCGQEIGEGARFCANCGSPADGNHGNVGTENLIGIIPGVSRKKGLFKSETFNILVTEKRMIFTLVTNEIMKEQATQLKGQGFLARLQGAASGEYITRRYHDIPPEQALKESPGNFSIDIAEVKKVKTKTGMSNPDNVHDSDGKLEIHTLREKFSFVLPAHSQVAAKMAFKNVGLS